MLFLSILNRIILESSYVRGIHNPTQQHNLDNIKIIGCKEQKTQPKEEQKLLNISIFETFLKKWDYNTGVVVVWYYSYFMSSEGIWVDLVNLVDSISHSPDRSNLRVLYK